MKRIFAFASILLLLTYGIAYGQPIGPGGIYGGGSSGSVATDAIWDAAGDTVYGTGSDTAGRLAKGTAYQLYMMNSGATAPAWTSTLGATGTRLTKGWFTDLEITNHPTVGGTALDALFQAIDADLTTIAGLTPAASKVMIGAAGPAWSVSSWTIADPGTSGNILKSDGTNWTSSNSLSIATLDLTSSTSSVPCPVGTGAAATAEGGCYHNSSTDVTTIGDGAAANELVKTAKTVITKAEYLPIRYMEDDDSVTAPAAVAEISTSTMVGRAFDKDADEGGVFWWQVPFDYSAGIKYRVYYSPAVNASADETAAFSLAGCSVGNSDAIACSEGTAVVVTDELTTDDDAGELMITGWSSAVTVTNIAAGEMAKLLFIRDVSEDDYASGDLIVVGIEIKYQAKLNASSDY